MIKKKLSDDVYIIVTENTGDIEVGPEVYVSLGNAKGQEIQNIAVIRNTDKHNTREYPRDFENAVEILVWGDKDNEDYTHKFEIDVGSDYGE